jgi:hypothetical protein
MRKINDVTFCVRCDTSHDITRGVCFTCWMREGKALVTGGDHKIVIGVNRNEELYDFFGWCRAYNCVVYLHEDVNEFLYFEVIASRQALENLLDDMYKENHIWIPMLEFITKFDEAYKETINYGT